MTQIEELKKELEELEAKEFAERVKEEYLKFKALEGML